MQLLILPVIRPVSKKRMQSWTAFCQLCPLDIWRRETLLCAGSGPWPAVGVTVTLQSSALSAEPQTQGVKLLIRCRQINWIHWKRNATSGWTDGRQHSRVGAQENRNVRVTWVMRSSLTHPPGSACLWATLHPGCTWWVSTDAGRAPRSRKVQNKQRNTQKRKSSFRIKK